MISTLITHTPLSPMTNTRKHISPNIRVCYSTSVILQLSMLTGFQTYPLHIQSRLYSATCSKARQVKVPTCCVIRAPDRFPLPECVFEDAIIQPYIHDCLVRVYEGRHVYHFRIFFKRHRHLHVNQSLRRLSASLIFCGDVLVMRAGARNRNSVVNMREHDTVLSDYVITK